MLENVRACHGRRGWGMAAGVACLFAAGCALDASGRGESDAEVAAAVRAVSACSAPASPSSAPSSPSPSPSPSVYCVDLATQACTSGATTTCLGSDGRSRTKCCRCDILPDGTVTHSWQDCVGGGGFPVP